MKSFYLMYGNMKDRQAKLVVRVANFGYMIASLILFAIAIWIVIASVVNIWAEVRTNGFTVYGLLDEVALIVFAFAVIDVSKYLVLEEVLRASKDAKPRDARKALRKLVVIIFTALSLEGLVLTIEMAKTDVKMMVYSSILIFVATLYLIGLGVYQWLSSKAEKIS